MTFNYRDCEGGVPFVLLSRPLLQPCLHSVGFLDEVSVAEPGDLGRWVGLDVGLQDQCGGVGLLQLGLLVHFGRNVIVVAGRSA